MRENARTRLAALREKKPPTKASQIRGLWPEIKAALDDGHRLKVTAECLAVDGIAVSVRSLSAYVGRIQRSSIGANQRTLPNPVARSVNVAPGSTTNSATTPAEAHSEGPRAPL